MSEMTVIGVLSIVFIGSVASARAAAPKPLEPVVEIEQVLYKYKEPNNGSGPMWCHGNTCILRMGEKVFASGIETLPDYKAYNNLRWILFEGTGGQLKQVADGGDTHEREPCPMVHLPGGRVFLSVNPSATKPNQVDGPAQPQVLEFSANDADAAHQKFKTIIPKWSIKYPGMAHTYRSFSADPPNAELVLMYNWAFYDRFYWTFYSKGEWKAQGKLSFPSSADFPLVSPSGKRLTEPKFMRVCYPAVELKDRAVHYLGVSDMREPYEEWRGYFSFDFRRLFYVWSDDITTGKFHDWVEVASHDKTGGYVNPLDLWIAPDNRVHILWYERELNQRADFRKKFTPGKKQRMATNYSIIKDGKVIATKPILELREGQEGDRPGRSARFHLTPDGRVLVLYSARTPAREWKTRLVEILPDGSLGSPVTVPLKRPFREQFFTAGHRSGCEPSWLIDVLGLTSRDKNGGTMGYARIRLK